jgi:hypothetical protein
MKTGAAKKNATSAIEHVMHRGDCYAILVRAHLPREGYNFVTEEACSLQVGINHYAAGAVIRPHYHLPVERALKDTLEVLHIDGGACRMKLFDQKQESFYETELRSGDTVILMMGGHGFEVIEPTRIIEVKQGPYAGPAKDKVFFPG